MSWKILTIGLALVIYNDICSAQIPSAPQVSTLIDSLPQTVGGVVLDALGYIYVADFEETVWRVNPYTKEVKVFATGFYGASGNSVDSKGRLYQANIRGNYINRVSRNGEVELFSDSLLSSPVGLVINPKNELFICNCGSRNIIKISPDGVSTEFAQSNLLYCPNGITIDPQDNLYIVSYHNNNVVKITPAGEVSLFAKTPDKIGNGHIVNSNGALYITGFHGHRVYEVDANGEVTILAGSGQRGTQDGSGEDAQFSYPNGIAISSDRKLLYINDMVSGEYQSPPLKPSKSSLRVIKLSRAIDLIKDEIDSNGVGGVMHYYQSLKERSDLTMEISKLEINSLAYNYMMVGKQKEASQVFQMSLDLYPDWYLTYAFMGRNMFIANQPKVALRHYKRALELYPDFESLLPIIAELEALK